jgi:hypothetical protein
MEPLSKEEHKQVVKDAIKEWLDQVAEDFGWWTFKYVGGALLGLVLYLLATNGYFK